MDTDRFLEDYDNIVREIEKIYTQVYIGEISPLSCYVSKLDEKYNTELFREFYESVTTDSKKTAYRNFFGLLTKLKDEIVLADGIWKERANEKLNKASLDVAKPDVHFGGGLWDLSVEFNNADSLNGTDQKRFLKNYNLIVATIGAHEDYFELEDYIYCLDERYHTESFSRIFLTSTDDVAKYVFPGDTVTSDEYVPLFIKNLHIRLRLFKEFISNKTPMQTPKEHPMKILRDQGCFPNAWWAKQPQPIVDVNCENMKQELNNTMNMMRKEEDVRLDYNSKNERDEN